MYVTIHYADIYPLKKKKVSTCFFLSFSSTFHVDCTAMRLETPKLFYIKDLSFVRERKVSVLFTEVGLFCRKVRTDEAGRFSLLLMGLYLGHEIRM